MKLSKRNALLCLLMYVAMFVLELYGVVTFFIYGASGNMTGIGVEIFKYYTIDSNIFCALGCLAAIPYAVRNLRGGNDETGYPHWLVLLRFSGTISLMLTFSVVLFYLFPMKGFWYLYGGSNLFLHFICPILSFVMTVWLEKGPRLNKKDIFYAIIPTVLYGIIYVIFVVYTDIWDDFYHFVINGIWIFTVLVIFAIITLFAVLTKKLYNRNQK